MEVGIKMGSRLKWDEVEVEGLNSNQLNLNNVKSIIYIISTAQHSTSQLKSNQLNSSHFNKQIKLPPQVSSRPPHVLVVGAVC